MRSMFALAALATLALSSPAMADQISVTTVAFSPAFQEKLNDDLGEREADVLRNGATRAISAELSRRGLAGIPATLEVTIVDARPNRPTLEQTSHRPGLSIMDSISTGGAELTGVLRATDGRVLAEVSHENYSNFNELLGSENTWTDTQREFRRFAAKVADAYMGAR